MPTFEVTGPDGGTYHLDAPDEHAAADAFSTFIKGAPPNDLPPGFVMGPPPSNDDLPPGFVMDAPDVSTTGDVAKSAGIGLVKGAIGLAGTIPEISEAAHNAANKYLFDPLFNAATGPKQDGPEPVDINKTFSPSGIQKGIENYTGPLYEPKTTAGRYAETAGEFAPAAIGGPEALIPRLATRVAAPAVASETAGELTKGTAAEPYARLGGALLGGAGAVGAMNKFEEANAARNAARAVPSADALKDAARAGYDHPDVAAVRIAPQAVSDLADTIQADLTKRGFRPRAGQGGVAFDTIDELRNSTAPVTVADIDSVRKALGQVGKSGIPTADSVAANKAIAHLDDFLPNLNQSDLLAGDATAANRIMQDARGNWAAAKRSNMLTDKIDAAELQAASANSGHNLENALRQRMRSVLTSPKLSRGLSSDERSAIEAFVRGGPVSNVVRHIGNYLGGGGGLGHLVTTGAGAAVAGVPGAIAAPAAGLALRAISNMTATAKVRALDTLLRSRSPLALQVAQQLPPQLVRSLPKQSAAILAAMSAQHQ